MFQSKTRDEWFDILIQADVPAGKVLSIDETCNDPQMRHREMIVEVDNPRFGKSKQIGFPIKFSDTPWQLRMGAAKLGDHTDEVLSDLGYSVDEIERLRKDQVVY